MDTSIGRNIQEMRLYRNMDVEKLAKKCKVEPELIGKWENNDIMPSAQELYVISKALDVDMNYFFEEIGESDDWYEGNEHNNLSSIILLLSESESVNPARRIFIWRWLKEQLVEYNLKKLDNPKFAVKNTTEKLREKIVWGFEAIFDGEYDDVIREYVKGECEIMKLRDAIYDKSKEHSKCEDQEKERKTATDAWKAYKQCVDYLESALFNELVDLRYAALAVEKLGEYYEVSGRMVDINFIVLKYVHTQLGNYCEKEDVEGVRRMYEFLKNYGTALWSQL